MNLLPSCEKCNQQPKKRPDGTLAGKGNRFPVTGTHAYDHADPLKSDIVNEKPLLLHPCIDNPDEHLKFLPETGALGWLTERGEKTIEICDLNNEHLCETRRDAYNQMKDAFLLAALTAKLGIAAPAQDVQKKAERYIKGDLAFSMVGRQAIIAARQQVVP